ncbi:MAG TPA: RNB domain-containing ribonuclease, partial [Thiolapillus brandeum]|nr:RNB domain-containing ribonuclease [Thiolapillus brandeum]
MSENKIQTGSLVLYKIRPAIVESVGEKYEIRFEDGRVKRVRQKDIRLLHPGPARGFDEVLEGPEGDPREAWELLQGESVSLAELAELVYGDYTPAAAWAAWQLLQEDLWFEGSVNAIRARDAETVARIREERERKVREAEEQAAFLERLQRGELAEEDRQRLQEVERVALGRSNRSRILASLDLAETPEAAHALLLRSGHWPEEHNPWPERQGALLESPDLPLPSLPEEERRDLTHLEAWAIDDEGNTDPDDAISLEGDRIWVHVADVAALVRPDSHLDLAARERSANLYLPERTVSMLPPALTDELGLGLQEISPALSFGFRLGAEGTVEEVEIT